MVTGRWFLSLTVHHKSFASGFRPDPLIEKKKKKKKKKFINTGDVYLGVIGANAGGSAVSAASFLSTILKAIQ